MGFFLHLGLLLIALSGGVPCIHAWGKEGHFMVCKIAEPLLKQDTMRVVQDLLPEVAGGDLAAVCSWADEVRFRYRWSSPLHYVNTPGVCNFQYKIETVTIPKGRKGCVWLEQSTTTPHSYRPMGILQINGLSDNLTESLMFLSHFMGDVHQPLHAGFEEDEGGNTIRVRWYRRMTNLHHVWDVKIIETAMKDFYGDDLSLMIDAIQRNLTDGWSDEIPDWESCSGKLVTCPNKYASESIRLACDYAYKDVRPESTLGDDYFFSWLPIVQKRIAQAGVRLASVLNQIFDASDGESMARMSQK